MKMKQVGVAVIAATLMVSGCANQTESEKYGSDQLGKTAHEQLRADRNLKSQDVCTKLTDALPKDELAKYNRDEVIKGCVRYNTSGE